MALSKLRRQYEIACRWVACVEGLLLLALLIRIVQVVFAVALQDQENPYLIGKLFYAVLFSVVVICLGGVMGIICIAELYGIFSKYLPQFPGWLSRETTTLTNYVKKVSINLFDWLCGNDLKKSSSEDDSDSTRSGP